MSRPLRVLFFMRHPLLNYRNFESTLRLLAERGHEVHVAYDVTGDEGDTDPIEGLARELPGLSWGQGPRRSKRDALMRLEQATGLAADYLRYFEPEYADAPKLRERYEARVVPTVRRATRMPLIGSRRGLRWLRRGLLWAGRSLPVRTEVDACLRERAPEIEPDPHRFENVGRARGGSERDFETRHACRDVRLRERPAVQAEDVVHRVAAHVETPPSGKRALRLLSLAHSSESLDRAEQK